MAAGRSYFARKSYRFLPVERDAPPSIVSDSLFELDESDVWSSTRSNSPEFRLPAMRSSRGGGSGKKAASGMSGVGSVPEIASSLPVNIPDWSKILKDDHRESRGGKGGGFGDKAGSDYASDGDEYASDGGSRLPPHEFLAKQLARTRIASFSVHEGVGRTLKGRDLSRVRNAIWEKTGFED